MALLDLSSAEEEPVGRADIAVAENLIIQPRPCESCCLGCSILVLPFCRGAFQ